MVRASGQRGPGSFISGSYREGYLMFDAARGIVGADAAAPMAEV